MTGEQILQQGKNSIKRNDKLSENEKQLLTNDLLHELRSGEAIQSGHTLKKHISKLKKISEYNEDLDLSDLDPSLELNKKIRNQIQESKWKRDNGEYAVKNKRDHWTAWKYLLKHIYNIDLERTDIIPPVSFSSNKEDVDIQADTKAKDLPTPEQMRKLLKALENVSQPKVQKRNTAYFLFLWDTGARRGEALNIKIGDVDPGPQELRINIKGNKDSKDRPNKIYQGEEYLKQYISNHPGQGNPDAYLFPRGYENELEKPVSGEQLAKKMRQAKASADLDFKDYGEPHHIFRKAMSTFYYIHIMDWDDICDRQGKGEGTKPDYILKAVEDREIKEAQGFGLKEKETTEPFMANNPLLPQKCQDCEKINHCLREYCTKCSTKLENSTLERNKEIFTEEEQEKQQFKAKVEQLMNMAEKLGHDPEKLID